MGNKPERFMSRDILSAHNQTKVCIARDCANKRHGETKYCLEHGKAAARRISKEAQVYFIMAIGSGCVKIGFSENPEKRLLQMQIGTPAKLILAGSVPIHQRYERVIHDYLRKHNVQGEWFGLSDEVIEFMRVATDEGRDGVMRVLRASGVAPWMGGEEKGVA